MKEGVNIKILIETIGLAGVKKTVGGVDYYHIPSNYTGWYVVGDEVPEQQKLSYFLEDIGLNAFYFITNHDFPIWMNSVQYNMPQHIQIFYRYYYHFHNY